MPTTYTHYAYGQEVFQRLSPELRKQIRPYMGYYHIGVHGPDILFYYRSFRKNGMNQYGVKVHQEPMRCFLEYAFSVYGRQDHKEEAFAYLAGFMTHYILDSTCHPYIRKRIRETGISHAEIETDWDYLMMKKYGKNPLHYKAARHIHTDRRKAEVIAPYYKKSPGQIQEGLRYMKFILNHVFHSHFGAKRELSSLINRYFLGGRSSFPHYFRKKRMNPQNEQTCRRLSEYYRESIPLCARMITELHEALCIDDRSFCRKKRFNQNFS
ncbi:MAG: zinc dependent phospholipase C family protein [Eubacteriales bacterium]|nr:zinc dependent phospholipase C family protein [Eubacteriales bacterium]